MSQTLNFTRNQIISKEELLTWDNSLRELLGNVLRYNRNTEQIGGILDGYNSDTSQFYNDFFKVVLGTTPYGGYNTIKILEGRGLLNFENTSEQFVSGLSTYNESLKNQFLALLKYPTTDNIIVDGIAGYTSGDEVYVGFVPIWNPLEDGVCSVSGTTNQVTISGGDFNKLRGHVTKCPIKIRLYDIDGAISANDETYEVISVVNSTQIIISGELTTASNLKYLIVGSYDLASQGSLSDKYSYVTAAGKLVFSEASVDITGTGGFIVAKLVFSTGGSFTISDMRLSNLFGFAFAPNIVYTDTAQDITGQKTFKESSPIFNIHKIDSPSSAASLLIPAVGDPNQYTITIPDSAGAVFKVKATNAGTGTNILKYIKFALGYSGGTNLRIIVDPTGVDLIIHASDSAYGISLYDGSGSFKMITVTKGSMIDLWANTSGVWQVPNSNLLSASPAWTQVTEVYDGSSSLLPTTTTVVKYKAYADRVVLHIWKTTSAIISFSLPFTFTFGVREGFNIDPAAGTASGEVVVDTDGAVTASFSDSVGTINKQMTIYL